MYIWKTIADGEDCSPAPTLRMSGIKSTCRLDELSTTSTTLWGVEVWKFWIQSKDLNAALLWAHCRPDGGVGLPLMRWLVLQSACWSVPGVCEWQVNGLMSRVLFGKLVGANPWYECSLSTIFPNPRFQGWRLMCAGQILMPLQPNLWLVMLGDIYKTDWLDI